MAQLKLFSKLFQFTLFILFVLLISSALSYGQNSQLDSLNLLVDQESDTEEKLKLLNEASSLASTMDFELGKHYSLKGLQIAEEVGNKEWLPIFSEATGRMYANLLKLDSATYYFNKALPAYQEIDNKKGQATTLFKIAWVHKRQGDMEAALKADLKALQYMEEIDNLEGMASAYSRISEDLKLQGRLAEAMDYAQKTIDLCEAHNFEEALVYAYTSAGDVQIAMGNNESSYNYYKKALDLGLQIGISPFTIANSKNNVGNALKRMGKYDQALAMYKEAMKVAESVDYKNAMYVIMANLGEVNLLLKRYEKALPYQLETVALQEANNDVSNLTENYTHLSTIYENLGDFQKALVFQKKAREMRDSTAKRESDRNMSELLTQYETEKKEATIANQNLRLAQQKRTQILYAGIALLLLLMFAGLYYYYRKRQKQNEALRLLNDELDVKNQQNELLLKEIHHRVKNNLELVKSLLSLQSAQIEDKATKEAMLASQHRVQSMGIIHQKLYQGVKLDAIEMKDYFLNLSEGILDSFQAEDRVKIECVMDQLELDIDTAVPIGLIVNELLTNALKYAFPQQQKGNIVISLAKTDSNHLQLQVADNGIGKDPTSKAEGTGFGTQLIRLLTQQLNGTMNERINEGTIVDFQFALQKAV